MSRQQKRVLALYRKHVMTRLRNAYGHGRISAQEYEQLCQRAVEIEHFSHMQALLRELRADEVAVPSRWGARRPLGRAERRERYERRWWKPEQMWGMSLLIPIVIGAVLIGVVVLLVRLVSAGVGVVAEFFSGLLPDSPARRATPVGDVFLSGTPRHVRR